MWIPSKVLDIFGVSKDILAAIKEENAALKLESAVLKQQLYVAQTNFDWLRIRVNTLETERGALFEKVTGVKTTIPEIVRQPSALDNMIQQFSFEDVGDKMAKELGLPTYDN
jgi:regulator of replication initiation timing